ncbi:MAG: protein translocase subunit SecD [Deltaproteobacteria bacterium]|nr:protein translocase subunit SecD [Deltaproteobacteria bacterium]
MSSNIKSRVIIFFAVLAASLVLLLPTVTKGGINTYFSKPIKLGLDLSGGAYLVYEVEASEAVKSRLQNVLNSLRSALRAEKISLVRAKVNDSNQIEFSLITDRSAERVQSLIQENYPLISLIEKTPEESRLRFVYGISPDQADKIKSEAISQAVETLRERVDQFGLTEPIIQKTGESRIMLQMPGVSNVQAVKDIVGRVAKLEFRLIAPGGGSGAVRMKSKEGGEVWVEDNVLMSGDSVDDARVEIMTGQREVYLTFTPEGRRTFARITTDYVQRQLAIILDNIVYSSPVIQEPITGGNARITGSFGMEEARELKIVLKAGALPAPLNVVEERTVGPTLGAESIRRGVLAILVGFAAIVCFLVVYYRKSGMIASLSLCLNMILVVAALSLFGATLTLPGLAGLALTVGMAVDSNVIIFERIKDEIRNGSTRDVAVRSGFEKALSAILDSNFTTLLAGAILYFLGTGPIRGFAVTLSIGVLTTIYCATFASRLAFDYFELKGQKQLSI